MDILLDFLVSKAQRLETYFLEVILAVFDVWSSKNRAARRSKFSNSRWVIVFCFEAALRSLVGPPLRDRFSGFIGRGGWIREM